MIRRTLTLACILLGAGVSPLAGQICREYGERIRAVASRSLTINVSDWARETYQGAQETLSRLADPEVRKEMIDRIFALKKQLQERSGKDSDYETARTRQWLEEQFNQWKGADGKNLSEMARETISTYFPALQGTDYADDPIKALSYLLIIDGKGFIKEVKCVRGPMGQPMTLLEAYEFYSRSDPQKAEDLLEIMDNIRKLSDPSCEQETVPLLLDSLGRSLRMLGK